MTKMLVGGCICAAIVLVVVISIMAFTAESISVVVAGDSAARHALTARLQISFCSRVACASSSFAASISGNFR